MRSFFDRLLEIEKTCKQVLEIIAEFTLFQNKWVYLQKIFEGVLSSALSHETKTWRSVNRFYNTTIIAIFETP